MRDALTAEEARWRGFFERSAVVSLRLTYEDLAADPAACLAAVLGALGRDPGDAARVEVRAGRMADAVSAAWLERMRSGDGARSTNL